MKNSPFYNFSKIVGGPPFSFFYPHTSNHRERIPKEGKVIICSNHISLKDPPMLALDTKRQIFYMAKSELFENFLLTAVLETPTHWTDAVKFWNKTVRLVSLLKVRVL